MMTTFLKGACVALCLLACGTVARAEEPLVLAKTGWLYAGGHLESVNGKQYMTGQMYAEYMLPARQTHPYPIIMVHGGTMSGTNFTGTPDGREGWAQYFARRGYAVYSVDQVGRGRSAFNQAFYGPAEQTEASNNQARYSAQERFNRWPQAHLHTQWPGDGSMNDPAVQQLVASQLPAIKDFRRQMELNRDGLVALIDKIGPSILLVHSQAGAFGWPVVDARPDKVKALVAVEPNGPPYRGVDFVGAPEWFKQQGVTLPWGLTGVPLTYDPAVKDASELTFVQEDKPQGEGLVRCFKQAEPARKLTRLMQAPTLVISSEASYHAPYDHCTVQYLQQAGVNPTWIKLADRGVRGNSHMMMVEKNNQDSAAVIDEWLTQAVKVTNDK
ncbi:MAG: alpha/beta-hydrolase [Hyphomicrobiales bacterium]|nr:alpha/beta-hydrolase [Hyphomicrobiales bacterium]